MISIAFEDEAYNAPKDFSPRHLFALRAKKGPCQIVPWKQKMLDIPVFRRAIKTKDGVETSKDAPLPYNQYHGWLVLLGVALGFIYTLTTYCLRRALGNAINGKTRNDDPNSNAAVRNLVLDHGTGSEIFERNYISRTIRYFTQDQFWGRSSDHESARTASQIGLLRDPDRPRKLSAEQGQQVRQDPEVRELAAVRGRLRAQIEEVFGVIEMAKGEPIYNDYQAVKASLAATIRKKERALLKRIQEEYDLNAPVLAIQQQLNGEQSDDDDDDDKGGIPTETVPIRIAERRYIAECAVRDPSVLRDQKGYAFHVEFSTNLIALCKRRDRRQVTTRCSPELASVKTTLDSPRLPEREPIVKRDNPLKCQDWQCLFCLASYDLPLEERKRKYKRKYTLQKHVDRCRLEYYGPDDPIPCPDGHACVD
ncbi:conserved hypothetical protein [Talaromyces stipitatus ATCC 10500]|uniref:Uncharacterized protein n=1 Tax=Talaromyces stipitatus (strain ATCC 10500 / CBS 375.48 / QM 6759 / NRRL 1006) TaxID=441959 RepID=B8MPU9_TALSN|nr:uncharacterized protein TSTA_052780 [Talaromyces stipitatus ATCC 10500]EED12757.1 conserved hypothetical protein [Talaromyces stipitatus ATCC 10500]